MAAVILHQNYQRFYLNENEEEINNFLKDNFNTYSYNKKPYDDNRGFVSNFRQNENKIQNNHMQNKKTNKLIEDKKQSQSSSDSSEENDEIHSESDDKDDDDDEEIKIPNEPNRIYENSRSFINK